MTCKNEAKVSVPTKHVCAQHRSCGLGQPGNAECDELRQLVDAQLQAELKEKDEGQYAR